MTNERDDVNRVLEAERDRIVELEKRVKQLEMQECDRCAIRSFVSFSVKLPRFCREKQYENVCIERDEAKRLVQLTNATVAALEERVTVLEKGNERLEMRVQDRCAS